MTDEFEVESNVPVVRAKQFAGKYPFHLMEAGHSFGFDGDRKRVNAVRRAADNWRKRNNSPAKFTIRKTADGSYRCWRTE